jgi:hypothetical protein
VSVDASANLPSPNGNVIKVTRAQVMAARELAAIAKETGEGLDPAVAAIASVSLEAAARSGGRRPSTAAPARAPHPTTG